MPNVPYQIVLNGELKFYAPRLADKRLDEKN